MLLPAMEDYVVLQRPSSTNNNDGASNDPIIDNWVRCGMGSLLTRRREKNFEYRSTKRLITLNITSAIKAQKEEYNDFGNK